jgi:hypothetical protein
MFARHPSDPKLIYMKIKKILNSSKILIEKKLLLGCATGKLPFTGKRFPHT